MQVFVCEQVACSGACFLSINRSKESATLDFKRADGRALLDRLIAKSDVVVENFRPGRQWTSAVLREDLGMSAADIDTLRDRGVI